MNQFSDKPTRDQCKWRCMIDKYVEKYNISPKYAMIKLKNDGAYKNICKCKIDFFEFMERCPNLQNEIITNPKLRRLRFLDIEKDFGKDWNFDMIKDIDKYIKPDDDISVTLDFSEML